ncbi:hypothetical protein [Streptomyces sp. NPDC048272]|uniref:DUF6197 family protein n=1 Tax=Streptomyces sp. NPDC048272 TaxID=3154616 RepID=UPI003440FC0A
MDTLLAAPRAAPALTLDGRLALTHLTMDERLEQASAGWAVDTAHIPLDAPELLAPAMLSPVAAVLQEARRLIADRGWCRRWLTDQTGALCLIGAIRTAAGGEGPLADQAEAVLLQVTGADSIAGWNGAQLGAAPVLAALERATRHADKRGI